MDAHFPQWTTELTTRVVPGEDHLGVEGAAQSYQQFLVPGIITTTDHARYYSFYAWVLYRFINGSSRLLKDFRGAYFKRHEVALIAGSYSHHKDGPPLGGLVGGGNNNSNAREIWESGDPISLDARYFQNELGGFGQYYRTAMQSLGLVAESEHPTWVYRLTPRGQLLAQAYEQSIQNTAYSRRLERDGSPDRLSWHDALEYGRAGCICAESLAQGQDLTPLRDAFFRFDQQSDSRNSHVRRRRTLGLTLDLVARATGSLTREQIRPGLYLGEYYRGFNYIPCPPLAEWAARWKNVEIRHIFTFGLQCLFAAFLLQLSEQSAGYSFDEYLDWARSTIGDVFYRASASDYLNGLCSAAGLSGNWSEDHTTFDQACRRASAIDEYSLFEEATRNRRSATFLLRQGLRVLGQLFLRFLWRHEGKDPIWKELAAEPRLPLSDYFTELLRNLEDPLWTVKDWLEWLYRDYVLGQHEFIALEKLRYQHYDTFKFHFRDGRFYWPFIRSDDYREPIRLAGLRIFMTLTILTDLGLVKEDESGRLGLTSEGISYWQRIQNEGNHDS